MDRVGREEPGKPPLQRARLGRTALEVCRLGLAGGYGTPAQEVRRALDRGVNLLWADAGWRGMAQVIRDLAPSERQRIVVAAGGDGRDGPAVEKDLARQLRALGTDYLDLFLCHYVESEEEFRQLTARDGGLEALRRARGAGAVRYVAISVHNRPLAAQMAASREFDVFFLRYNPAHPGAEREVFPATQSAGVGVIVFTASRWGELFSAPKSWRGTPPQAHELYRFPLEHPAVHAVVAAPRTAGQLDEDLRAVQGGFRLSPERLEELRRYGQLFREMA